MAWSNESRHKRGYGHQWDKLRKVILERDKYLCQPCLRQGKVHTANEVDHKLAKANGGTDDPANLEAINSVCHKIKTARDNGKEYKPKQTFGVDGWPA